MSRPIVSDAAERIYDRLVAYQPGDDQNGWLLLHLCEARARTQAKVQQTVRHDEAGSGWRRMHDPLRAPDWYLPRLRDLVGNDDEGLTGDRLRNSILTRPRARRCTFPALASAVLETLTPYATAQDVRVRERFGGSPYALLVITRPAHTPDPEATYRAARRHKPLFVVLTHIIDDSVLIGEATLTLGQVADTVTVGGAQPGQV